MTFLRRVTRLQIARRRDGRLVGRFLANAEASASDGQPWAIAVACVAGLQRLSVKKVRGAMDSMRLYLVGFVEDGEFFERIAQSEYGMMLRCVDETVFERRLEILRQDSRYLYMAAHPGKNMYARVTACRVADASGAAEALKLAQERNAAADEHRN